MKKEIIAFTDYKGYFGSKYNAVPYNSGMDKDLLKKYFLENDIEIRFIKFNDINYYPITYWKDKLIIYTSSEDKGYYYKDYIEDSIYFLKMCGAVLIPDYKFLRANNNKVFMELLRKSYEDESLVNISSRVCGTLEDAVSLNCTKFPMVFKTAQGAMSEGVSLVHNTKEMIKAIKKFSNTFKLKEFFRELIRSIKYEGYLRESFYRNKFILQNFISGLEYDTKVLIFYDKYLVFKRPNRKNDFRASGSGNQNYLYALEAMPSNELLNYSLKIYELLDTPTLSLDIAMVNKEFFLIEFQALYFGTVGVVKSPGYFLQKQNNWEFVEGYQEIEFLYSNAICNFISHKFSK